LEVEGWICVHCNAEKASFKARQEEIKVWTTV
jgi:hypothetical protein